MRYGVHTVGHEYQMSSNTKLIYDKLHNDRKQAEEQGKIDTKRKPIAIQLMTGFIPKTLT